ncbi:unnamed protein product [Rhizoctonia solani]|uniref:DUF6535 domain-containing protein n=1 Tax=Rhizoctonia solani TaxID=456999 RepID=A0A8H2XAM8_9AGAM|nr:unnamed protein product [Rhizoctonia solani]
MEPDEYGAELGKEARVWKVYVKETDRWDTELVDGWNKSLDVILVFAALFSAILTAFLIESSNTLREDPNDVSAAALLSISASLRALANSSTIDLPDSGPGTTSEFIPPQHTVIVNTLWYLSLSLSVSTSLLAMLAKDWCHSFSSNRTGHPWDQALRRQRKWVMIERWKMQELITVLPSFIHLSLLLFAVGLCIYVWDLNSTAAIPVICVSGAVFIFFIWSSVMASFVKLFPYTTIVSRVLQVDFVRARITSMAKLVDRTTSVLAAILLGFILNTIATACLATYLLVTPMISILFWPAVVLELLGVRLSPTLSFHKLECRHIFAGALKQFDRWLGVYYPRILNYLYTAFHPSRWQRHETYSSDDRMTSLALQWLIQNCETPNSVAITLQAIAGASSRIPREPLEFCQAALHIFRRLVSGSPENRVEMDNKLYTRALTFLGSHPQPVRGRGTADMDVLIWELKSEHERQVVHLINTSNFSSTPENLQTLSAGNAAISLSLSQLQGDTQNIPGTFISIISQLLGYLKSENQNLDPAALQSLAFAAILLTSRSDHTLFSPAIVTECASHCVQFWDSGGSTSDSDNMLDPHVVFVVCMLLHAHSAPDRTGGELAKTASIRLNCAARILTDQSLRKSSFQSMFFRIALCEILFNPKRYGLNTLTEQVYSMWRSDVSNTYLQLKLLLPGGRLEEPRTSRSKDENRPYSELFTAIDRVYELVSPLYLQDSIIETLPPPVYCTLIWITCLDIKNVAYEQMLSKLAFPSMNGFFAAAVSGVVPQLWKACGPLDPEPVHDSSGPAPIEGAIAESPKSWVPNWGTLWLRITTGSKKRPSDPSNSEDKTRQESRLGTQETRLRHFAATQLWLLLYFVGNSPPNQQQELRHVLEENTGLRIEGSKLKKVKAQLEDVIIKSHQKGSHLGLYSARIIECIFEDRMDQAEETQEQRDLRDRISRTLRDVSPRLRGLRSFSDPSTPPANEQQDHHPGFNSG